MLQRLMRWRAGSLWLREELAFDGALLASSGIADSRQVACGDARVWRMATQTCVSMSNHPPGR